LMRADESVLVIKGNAITHDYKIINIIRQTHLPHVQIFKLDTKELEENLCQLQTIKKAYIRRYWFPARLVVTVEERVPVFLLAPNLESEPNSALTTDGVLIDSEYFPFKVKVKAKKLLTYGVKDGVDEVWNKKKVDAIINLTKAIEAYSEQEVQYIDYRTRDDVYIMLKDFLVRFGEINDTALKRAKWIATLLPQAQKLGSKTKYIDLRWEDSQFIRLIGDEESHVHQPSSYPKKPKKENNTEVVVEQNEPEEIPQEPQEEDIPE
ncbi:FtsQ-type POTRA domain-containing protein, partial [bacterium]|nr:FtsQ-type POTRA domain-containing protein [bacterium]